MTQFNKEALQVDDANDRMIVVALMAGLERSKLLFSLSKNPPTRMADLMVKAQQHMNAEDILNARRERDVGSNPQHDKRKRKPQQGSREERGARARDGGIIHGTRPRAHLPPSKFHNYTPLNAPME